MNISPGRRKQFVSVEAKHLIDGTIELKRIILADGSVFEIDSFRDPYVTAGGIKRYPITIRGKETYVYELDGRWWVMAKK